MTHNLLHWESVLKRAGYRVTKQREVILDAVCSGAGHVSFDDILLRSKQRDRVVDRSTVYRALRLFTDLGLIVEAKIEGETLYEVTKVAHHHHLVCRVCGAEREVTDEAIQGIVDHVLVAHRFRVSTDHLLLYGVCEACDQLI